MHASRTSVEPIAKNGDIPARTAVYVKISTSRKGELHHSCNVLAMELAGGSKEAFDQLYSKYIDKLLDFARSFTGSTHDAEDICADVFEKMWKLRDRFSNVKNIEGFLFASIRNASLNFLKYNANKKLEELHIHIDPVIPPEPLQEMRSEYKRLVLQEIQSLSPQRKVVFELACFEGLKNEEIASRLGISKLTVKSHKKHALRLLRLATSGAKVISFALFTASLLF